MHVASHVLFVGLSDVRRFDHCLTGFRLDFSFELCSNNGVNQVGGTQFVWLLVTPGSGWLGSRSRRRTWQAAISLGEVHAALEPKISECDFVTWFARLCGNAR